MRKKALAWFLAASISAAALTGCAGKAVDTSSVTPSVTTPVTEEVTQAVKEEKAEAGIPKYIFLFIGDGMSFPQFQAASDYLGAVGDPDPELLKGGKQLSFTEFPILGSATTFDSTSFAPDSASTATSISTGYKTHSGVINMDETKTKSYETIAEKLKSQLEYKVGVISTVNLNHATPAAFYAHQPSRGNYYEIGVELVESGYDYFAGGGLLEPEGKEENQKSIYTLAADNGYRVVKTQAEAEALKPGEGKAVIIGETLADADSLSYANDAAEGEWQLKDYVKKGIELLDNEKGFFLMAEGGKIDWACHANDAGSTISDTVALSDAVAEAVSFYNEHPEETLILVTGDHETGGLSIGFAGTDYDTYLQNLQQQKISYAKFDTDYVSRYKEEKTTFEEVLKDIEKQFGLAAKTDQTEEEQNRLILTDYELSKLEAAYEKTMSGGIGEEPSQEDYVLYGTYEPLTVTITHLLNNKSGIDFTSYSHTGLPVPVFAQGSGKELFGGYYDNTDIYRKVAELTGVK